MIPAVEAYVANALGLGPRLSRLPITQSGCAGGIVGLARALDFLVAHPDSAALVLALEFASLTFQAWDLSPANVVSTAIFGDGGAAVLLVGAEHPRARDARLGLLGSSSVFLPDTTRLMGFELKNQGLRIVLDKALTRVVKSTVRDTVGDFLKEWESERSLVAHWILHPGGRRVIDVMAEELALPEGALGATAQVLAEHGNMSSVTVLFVLDELLRSGAARSGDLGLMAAFGPGFGAELLLTEFA
jgi:alkylresorcinol/alkylpyrone synthase